MTIAELLISMGVELKGAKEAEEGLFGAHKAADDLGDEGSKSLREFGVAGAKAFAAVGAAAVAAAVGIFKAVDSVTSANDEIIKSAKVAGLGTDEYQKLAFAAQISGTNIKQIEVASRTVARGLNDAKTKGTGPLVEGLELLGLRLEDVQDLPFEKQLGVFSDAMNRLGTEQEKTAASSLIFGSRAGPKMATLLAEGSAGIKALGDEAESLGAVIGGPALEQAAEFQDSITRLKATFGGFASDIATDLAPLIKEMIDGFKDWAVANKGVIAEDIKGFIKGAIPILKAFVSGIGFVVDAIKGFIEIMGGVGPAMGLATTAVVAFKLAMAGALGPVSAIGLAIGGLISVVAGLVSQFGDMNDELSETEERAARLRNRRKELGEATDAATAGVERTNKFIEENNRQRAEVRKAAEDRSGTFQRSFAERQRAGARVREQLAERGVTGRRADKMVSDVILGKTTEEKALERPKRGGGGRGRGKSAAAAKEPESDVTLAESLIAIRTGTADPKQLKQVIQQLSRKTPSSKAIKPTVAIDFFNFQITQNFRGGDPMASGRESAKAIRGEFEKGVSRAAQSIPQSVIR